MTQTSIFPFAFFSCSTRLCAPQTERRWGNLLPSDLHFIAANNFSASSLSPHSSRNEHKKKPFEVVCFSDCLSTNFSFFLSSQFPGWKKTSRRIEKPFSLSTENKQTANCYARPKFGPGIASLCPEIIAGAFSGVDRSWMLFSSSRMEILGI